MGARKIYETTFSFFCVFLASDIVSHKIYKKNEYSMFLKFYEVLGVYGRSKGQNVIKRHGS